MLILNIIPLVVFLAASAALFIFATVVLIGSATFISTHPTVLPIEWHNLYASHDPVPKGALDVVGEQHTPHGGYSGTKSQDHVQEFYDRQKALTNLKSSFADHTSYWSSQDDFVGRVSVLLADWANIPIAPGADRAWLQMSRARRR